MILDCSVNGTELEELVAKEIPVIETATSTTVGIITGIKIQEEGPIRKSYYLETTGETIGLQHWNRSKTPPQLMLPYGYSMGRPLQEE